LLDKEHLSMSRESLFKIKPEDIQLSHSVKFDRGLQFKAFEGLSKLFSKGHILSEENIRSEMNLSEISWNTFGKDITDLLQGIPNPNLDSPQKMLIMVGVPGSGKSTVANRLINMNNNWVRVNQDEMKTRKACENVARDSLKRGKSVIVDRCNFDFQQRNVWIKIASEFSVTDIRCMYFKIPLHICKQRIVVREDHPTIPSGDSGIQIIDNFSNQFVPPSTLEGISQILTVTDDDDVELAISNLAMIALSLTKEKPQRKTDPSRYNNPQSPTKEKTKTGNYNSFSLLDEDN